MRLAWPIALLLIAIGVRATEKECPTPIWSANLSTQYHFNPFGMATHPRNQPPWPWKLSQGVAFTSSSVLAVYQVLENAENSPLQPRDASTGGGKYVLHVVFLDTATGKELHTLHLTTTGLDVSGIYPTHDGRFAVATGQLLRLYSPSFEEICSRSFPTSPYGKSESWRVSVVPGGKRLHISAAEHYLLDSDTLETLWNPKPSDVAFSGDGNRFFPELRNLDGGVSNSEGQTMRLDLHSNYQNRILWTFLDVPKKDSGGWAPKELRVFSARGRLVWTINTHDKFSSFSSNGALIAVAIYKDRPNPFDMDLAPKPVQIAIYDLYEKVERCSVRVSLPEFYDLSSADGLAAIQGDILSFYSLTSR